MYFWRIEKLKTEMAERPLSEREVLPYLVVFVALTSAISYIPQPLHNVWDGLGAFVSVFLASAGALYIYRQNGGANGRHFLQRFFAIGWVAGIRCLPGIVLSSFALYFTLEAVAADTESTHWYDVGFFAAVEAMIYWKIGRHVRDLAQRATTD